MTTRAICKWGDEEQAKAKLQGLMASLSKGTMESWRFTPVAPVIRQQLYKIADKKVDTQAKVTIKDDGIYIDVTDGVVQVQDSDVQYLKAEGVHLYSQQHKAAQLMLSSNLGYVMDIFASPIATLNAAYAKDVLVIAIDEGVELKKPLFVRTKTREKQKTTLTRALVMVSAGAQCQIIEEYIGDDCQGIVAPVMEVIVGENAQCRHYKMQATTIDGVHLATTAVQVAGGASYQRIVCQTGAKLARDEIQVYGIGKNADIEVAGIYIGTGQQHLDNTIFVKHQEEAMVSRQVYRGVLADSARGVFQGKIHVDQVAQQTDGYQINRTITLSDKVLMSAKPELEIYADDVKCSHGSIMGSLDGSELYYLRSRGVNKHQAQKILLRAHVDDVLTSIKDQTIRDGFCRQVDEVLNEMSFAE